MNSAFALTKLKFGLGGKNKFDNLERIEDVNDNNKITIQPSEYSGIFKINVNKIRKVIFDKKYKGHLSSGILTLRRIKNKINMNIAVHLSVVDIYYDKTKNFFLFVSPHISLRAKTKQKEFDIWKRMISQHRWYIQYNNKGNLIKKEDGIKMSDLEGDDETSDYTDDSTKSLGNSQNSQILNVSKKINSLKELTITDRSLCVNCNVSLVKKKSNDSPINLISTEVIEEMMELIKLLMSTVQTINDRIVKLELSSPMKDVDNNNSKEVPEKCNVIKTKYEEVNDILKQINKVKKEPSLQGTSNIQQQSSENNTTNTTLKIFKNRKRREVLPATETIPEALSYSQIFKCFLSGGHFPISIYEPISSLQFLCCEFQNAKILNDIVNLPTPVERILKVTEFVIGSSSDILVSGRRKCFSSFPGETFDYVSDDGWKFHGEHILKSPMTAASYIEHETWEMFMAYEVQCKMSYNSAEVYSDLPIKLNLKNGESFTWKKPKVCANNIKDLPKYRQQYYSDTIKIKNSSGLTVELSFDKTGEIEGYLMDDKRKILAEIDGNYLSGVKYIINSKQHTLYIAPNKTLYDSNFYSFNKFTIGINELFKDEIPYIPKSDSRFRKDMRYLEEGLAEKSYNEKISLSEKYRNVKEHTPLWFTKVFDQFSGSVLYKSNFKYWQSKMEKFNTAEGKMVPILF